MPRDLPRKHASEVRHDYESGKYVTLQTTKELFILLSFQEVYLLLFLFVYRYVQAECATDQKLVPSGLVLVEIPACSMRAGIWTLVLMIEQQILLADEPPWEPKLVLS